MANEELEEDDDDMVGLPGKRLKRRKKKKKIPKKKPVPKEPEIDVRDLLMAKAYGGMS